MHCMNQIITYVLGNIIATCMMQHSDILSMIGTTNTIKQSSLIKLATE